MTSHRHAELPALGRLVADAADWLITSTAQELHHAIARRAFPPGSTPAKAMHDGIATAVYGGIRGGTRLLGSAAGSALHLYNGGDARAVTRTRRGAVAVAAANALIGDLLEDEGNALAIPMQVTDTRAIEPGARVVMFLHGLGETEHAWSLGPGERFADRLTADLGVMPLHLRYNSGLPVEENGRRLAALLDQKLPERASVAFVGHSMGGLVARSACTAAARADVPWLQRTTHVVCLGSPHGGSPVAKLAERGALALSLVPEGRPFGSILERRSPGIRDLERGLHPGDHPLAAHVAHRAIAAVLTEDPRHPIGRIVGDGLVREDSGCADRADGWEVDCIGGLGHFGLLYDDRVYARLHRWLAEERQPRLQPARRRLLPRGSK